MIPSRDVGEFDGVQSVFEARLLVICNVGTAPIDLLGLVPERSFDIALTISRSDHDQDYVIGTWIEITDLDGGG